MRRPGDPHARQILGALIRARQRFDTRALAELAPDLTPRQQAAAIALEQAYARAWERKARTRIRRATQADPTREGALAVLPRERNILAGHLAMTAARITARSDIAALRAGGETHGYWMRSDRPWTESCIECQQMSGRVWPLDGLALRGPPRHPHCGCRILAPRVARAWGLPVHDPLPAPVLPTRRKGGVGGLLAAFGVGALTGATAEALMAATQHVMGQVSRTQEAAREAGLSATASERLGAVLRETLMPTWATPAHDAPRRADHAPSVGEWELAGGELGDTQAQVLVALKRSRSLNVTDALTGRVRIIAVTTADAERLETLLPQLRSTRSSAGLDVADTAPLPPPHTSSMREAERPWDPSRHPRGKTTLPSTEGSFKDATDVRSRRRARGTSPDAGRSRDHEHTVRRVPRTRTAKHPPIPKVPIDHADEHSAPFPNAVPHRPPGTNEELEAQRIAYAIADPGPEQGAADAWSQWIAKESRAANRAINVALGPDLAKFIDRQWGKHARVRQRLLEGDLTVEQTEELAYEEWRRIEAKRMQREVARDLDYGLKRKPLPCFDCGRLKRRPSDVCEHCGDNPVQVGTSKHEFDRDYGYGGNY